MFTVHTASEEFKNNQWSFWICVWHDFRDAIVFEKLHFQNVFRPHENEKPAFSNSFGLKTNPEKFRFRDELIGTLSNDGGDAKDDAW